MRAAAALGALGALVLAAGPAGARPPQQGLGVGGGQGPAPTKLAREGAALYGGNCATCHGSDGEGIPTPTAGAGQVKGQGPSLRGVGALAADFYLSTGYMPLSHPGVQPYRSRVLLTAHELRALVAYVASLGKGPPIPKPHPERGSASIGQRLFASHCAGCHQIVAKGGYVTDARVPPLEKATPVQIAEAVRIGPYVMPKFSKRAISDGQLDSLIAYVQSTKHPDDRGGWSLGNVGPIPEGIVTWLIGAALLVALCVVIGERLKRTPEQ